MKVDEKNQVLITGAGGFVGRNLTQYLLAKYSVLTFARKDLDLLDPEKVADIFQYYPKIKTVIHCASDGGASRNNFDEGKIDVVDKNLRMFFNLARCLRSDQRLIHLGSGAEYDRRHYHAKMPETYFDSHVPADAYGFAKYTISQFIAQRDNMLCLRIFGLYGQGEDYRYKFISNAIVKGLLGLPITISQNVIFDYLFIDDFVALIEKILASDWPYRHMNITPTQSTDIVSLAQLANEATDNKNGITVLRQGLNTEYTGDNRRLLEVVGPYDFTSYSAGIGKLTEYYRYVLADLDLETVRDDPYLAKCLDRK